MFYKENTPKEGIRGFTFFHFGNGNGRSDGGSVFYTHNHHGVEVCI